MGTYIFGLDLLFSWQRHARIRKHTTRLSRALARSLSPSLDNLSLLVLSLMLYVCYLITFPILATTAKLMLDAKVALIKYLVMVRSAHMPMSVLCLALRTISFRPPFARVLIRGYCTWFSCNSSAVSPAVDSALLMLYAETNPPSAVTLAESDNQCRLDKCLPTLKKHRLYHVCVDRTDSVSSSCRPLTVWSCSHLQPAHR